MSYILIKGKFYVVGFSPDGDSIKFRADNPSQWKKIVSDHAETFFKKTLNPEDAEDPQFGITTLRLQGIDALETHYAIPPIPNPSDIIFTPPNMPRPDRSSRSQPGDIGRQAATFFLKYLNIEEVHWSPTGRTVSSIEVKDERKIIRVGTKLAEEIPGFIIVRDFERNGRPLAWVFEGTTRTSDGKLISKSDLKRRLKRSANYTLLKEGLVYPYFYMTLPAALRDELAHAVKAARQAAEPFAKSKRAQTARLKEIQAAIKPGSYIPQKLPNVWVYDRSTKGARLSTISEITDTSEIWPYLFRRILRHWYAENMDRYFEAIRNDKIYNPATEDQIDLTNFFMNSNPYLLQLTNTDFVRLDELIEIKRGRLKMEKSPEALVFLG